MWWLWLSAGWAACTMESTPRDLSEAVERAEVAFVEVEPEAFDRAVLEVDWLLPCLGAPVSPQLSAKVHRLRGVGYLSAQKPGMLEAAFRAARAADPDLRSDPALFPERSTLAEAWEAAGDPAERGPRLPPPAGGELRIDGAVAKHRPRSVPVLVQVLVGDEVQRTDYLLPSDAMPDYRGANRPRNRWLGVGAATLAAGAGLYGLAASQAVRVPGAADAAELRAAQRATNGLVVASGAVVLGSAIPFSLAAMASRPL